MSDKNDLKGLLKIKVSDGNINNSEVTVDGVKLEMVTGIEIHPLTPDNLFVTATITLRRVLIG